MTFNNGNSIALKYNGYTVLEVIVAIFIFGGISTAMFRLIAHTDRIRGRVIFVENAVQLAANEAERLRNIAAQSGIFTDSTFTEIITGRSFSVERNIIENNDINSILPHPPEPVEIELIVSDALHAEMIPLRFKLLVGSDRP
jgi:hypothetical protein